MLTEQQYEGYWHLPGKKGGRVWGVLYVEKEQSLRLKIHGSFKQKQQESEFIDIEVLHGNTKDKLITLVNCQEIQFSGLNHSVYTVELALIGQHVKSINDISFNILNLEFTDLAEWVNSKNRFPRFGQTDDNTFDMINEHESAPVLSNDDYTISVSTHWSESFSYKTLTFRQSTVLVVSFSQLTSFQEARELSHQFQHLLTFTMHRPVLLTSFKAILVKDKIVKSLDILYRPPYWHTNRYSRYIFGEGPNHLEQVLPFTSVQENPQIDLQKWFTKYPELEKIYTLYFSVVYSDSLYVEEKFMRFAQALEAYHRIRVSIGKFEDDDVYWNGLYQRLVEALPVNLEPTYRANIEGKLKYLHEFTLRKRIFELIKLCAPLVPASFLCADKNSKDAKKIRNNFAMKMADFRNDLTHHDEGREEPDIETLARSAEWLRFLLEVIFLYELDIPASTIQALISKSPVYKHLGTLDSFLTYLDTKKNNETT